MIMNDLEPILQEALEDTIFEVNLRLIEDSFNEEFPPKVPIMFIENYQEFRIEIPKKKFSLRKLIKKIFRK